jgi:hypothetical protein
MVSPAYQGPRGSSLVKGRACGPYMSGSDAARKGENLSLDDKEKGFLIKSQQSLLLVSLTFVAVCLRQWLEDPQNIGRKSQPFETCVASTIVLLPLHRCQKGGIVSGQKDSSEDEGCWFLMLKKRSASDADSLYVDGNKVKIGTVIKIDNDCHPNSARSYSKTECCVSWKRLFRAERKVGLEREGLRERREKTKGGNGEKARSPTYR